MQKIIKKQIGRLHLPIKKKRYKIAITGLSRVGKSVFITSFIDQLLFRDKIPFITNKRAFRATLLPPDTKAKRFDYYSFIKQIKKEHSWPSGTSEITTTRVHIERKNPSLFQNSSFELEIVDYPGEWLLDLCLLELSFKQWSEEALEWLERINDEDAKGYLALLKEDVEASVLIRAYKSLLFRLRDKNFTNLTPGRFIMPKDLENDPILEFAPLAPTHSLEDEFSQKYDRYVSEIVKNIQLEHFRDFDRQIVLVDVIKALQNGYGCYSDMKAGLSKIVSLYDHKKHGLLRRLFTPTISRVVFGAPKCDLLSISQHQNYKALLLEMVKPYIEELSFSGIKSSSHVFASMKCTESVKSKYQGRTLSYIRGINPETKKLQDHYPGEIPPTFPHKNRWDSEEYDYIEVLPPQKEYRDDEALEHINMDEIIDALIGDLL